MSEPARVLVVAHKTAATQALVDAVRERAQRGPAKFTLLVPKAVHGITRVADPEDAPDDEARDVMALAMPLLEDAAGDRVEGLVGVSSPLDAIQDAVNIHGFDEIIISTLPSRVSRWLHIDLPSKLNGLGLPVTTVTAQERAAAIDRG
ncbi:MAG TPA: universal stress protein [Solirubrobacteraceae bacterium]|nr:universal stress protein [Solirubrobacteraceae bacterium]